MWSQHIGNVSFAQGQGPLAHFRAPGRLDVLALLIFAAVFASCSQAALRTAPTWWDPDGVGTGSDWHYRVPVTLPATSTVNSTGKDDIDFAALKTQLGISGTFDANSVRVVRPNGSLATLQEYTGSVNAGATLVTKVSSVIADPVNGTNMSKTIPGEMVEHCILISNTGATTFTYASGTKFSGTSCAGAATAEHDNATGTDETEPYGASISGTTLTAAAATLATSGSFALRSRGGNQLMNMIFNYLRIRPHVGWYAIPGAFPPQCQLSAY